MTLKLLSLIVLFSLETKAATLIITEANVSVFERKPDDPLDSWKLGDISSDHIKLYSSPLVIGFSGGPNPANYIPNKPGDLLQWEFFFDPLSVTEPFNLIWVNDPNTPRTGIILATFPANTFHILGTSSNVNDFEFYSGGPDYRGFNSIFETEFRAYQTSTIISKNIVPQIPEPSVLHLVCISLVYNVLNRRKDAFAYDNNTRG